MKNFHNAKKFHVGDKGYGRHYGNEKDCPVCQSVSMKSNYNMKNFHHYHDFIKQRDQNTIKMNKQQFLHELKNINTQKYGIKNFFTLSSNPEVDYFFKRNGKQIPIYKLCRIAGTVIGKNDTRHSVTLLTIDGVVNVKFTRDYYAMFNRQLSEKDDQGVKKVKEKGWFTRGTKLLVTGYRRDDTFVSKKYKATGGHQLYKITDIEGRNINITSERYGVENE